MLSPTDFKSSWNSAPLVFKTKYYWDSSSQWGPLSVAGMPSLEFVPLPSLSLQHPFLLQTVSQVHLAPSWLYLHSFYPLQCGLFFTFICRESFLPVFRSFSGFLHRCGYYLDVSMGQVEPRRSSNSAVFPHFWTFSDHSKMPGCFWKCGQILVQHPKNFQVWVTIFYLARFLLVFPICTCNCSSFPFLNSGGIYFCTDIWLRH